MAGGCCLAQASSRRKTSRCPNSSMRRRSSSRNMSKRSSFFRCSDMLDGRVRPKKVCVPSTGGSCHLPSEAVGVTSQWLRRKLRMARSLRSPTLPWRRLLLGRGGRTRGTAPRGTLAFGGGAGRPLLMRCTLRVEQGRRSRRMVAAIGACSGKGGKQYPVRTSWAGASRPPPSSPASSSPKLSSATSRSAARLGDFRLPAEACCPRQQRCSKGTQASSSCCRNFANTATVPADNDSSVALSLGTCCGPALTVCSLARQPVRGALPGRRVDPSQHG